MMAKVDSMLEIQVQDLRDDVESGEELTRLGL